MGPKKDRLGVVVGVDYSRACKHAILEGLRLADMSGRAAVHFVHVVEVSPDLHDAERIDQLSESIGQVMAKLERHVRDTLYVDGVEASFRTELVYHVRIGPVARELQQVAVDTDADLMVVGQPHAGKLRRLFAKSTAEQLVRTARVPVVIARPKDFAGLPKSPTVEPPRPGEDLTRSGTYATVELYDSSRGTHIAGML